MEEYITPLLATLREQKEMKMKGGIYHKTQIDLTYNSNHIEGSRLTHDQTRYIFETNTIGVTADETINVNDIVETVNHFRCIDLIIDKAEEPLSEELAKTLHGILKSGTSNSYHAQQVSGRTLPMSVVRTSEMTAVAQATRNVLTGIKSRLGGNYADLTGLIHYYNTGAIFNADDNFFYDAGDFVRKYASAGDYQAWRQALERAVVSKNFAAMWNTNKLWSTFYTDFTATEDRCHGVSMYVAQDPARGSYARYHKSIKQMQWYTAAGLNTIGW